MAAIHTLINIGGSGPEQTGGVALPKDDLRIAGLVDEDGNLADDVSLIVKYVSDGEWRVQVADNNPTYHASD